MRGTIDMEQDEVTMKRMQNEEELTQVASLIQPLPDNVIPSEEFMRRTRMRLLKLKGKSESSRQQAA